MVMLVGLLMFLRGDGPLSSPIWQQSFMLNEGVLAFNRRDCQGPLAHNESRGSDKQCKNHQ
jgi:hypothetical protein